MSETLHAKMLVNLCVAMLISLLFFLLAGYATDVNLQCQVWAIGMHYFWLVALIWMTLQGFNLLIVFKQIVVLDEKMRLFKYMIFGWGLPLVIVIFTTVITPSSYGGANAKFCWINSSLLLYFFSMPLRYLLVMQFILFYSNC